MEKLKRNLLVRLLSGILWLEEKIVMRIGHFGILAASAAMLLGSSLQDQHGGQNRVQDGFE